MRLCYFAPSPRQRNLLTMHAVVEDLSAPAAELVPAMLANLHIRIAGTSSYVFADGRRIPAPPVSIVGPTNAAYRLEMSDDIRMAAVGFLPQGWHRLIHCPATAMADDVVDGEVVWGRQACEELRERLALTPWDGDHIGVVEDMLAGADRSAAPSAFVQAVDHWLERQRSFSVEHLCAELEIGRRQLQRLMRDHYGAPPKLIAMKYRALDAAARLVTGEAVPVRNLLSHYADQPHLIRDFQRFIGMTPGAFMRSKVPTAAATMIGRRKAGATRPLVLWS